MRKTVILAILDGWGIGRKDETNPIHAAGLKHIKYIEENFPLGALQASGISVGLPWNEEGNSEVGHLTIGAGKILFQNYPKISLSIRDGSFFNIRVLKDAFAHAEKNKSTVHLIGLIGGGVVHSATEHVEALLEMARRGECKKLSIHAFADGRDSDPFSAEDTFKKLSLVMAEKGIGSISSICGRYYGMDRDKHWERTEKAYNLLVSPLSARNMKLEDVLVQSKQKEIKDEYIEPAVIGDPSPISPNDSVIFFNFREDRMRQITRAIWDPAFSAFKTKQIQNLYLTSLIEYEKETPMYVAFEKKSIEHPLGEILSKNGKTQLKIAETEKYAHITYFFNGLKEPPYPNEYRVLIPSKNIVHYETFPEMMASAITDRATNALKDGGFDFILLNYANPDIVAHTGNYDATVKAVQCVDREVGKLVSSALDGNHTLIITSDHGNAENVINLQSGEPQTKHDSSPVPFYLVGNSFKTTNKLGWSYKIPSIGFLSDVAPTILELMGIRKPEGMSGQSLLDQLI